MWVGILPDQISKITFIAKRIASTYHVGHLSKTNVTNFLSTLGLGLTFSVRLTFFKVVEAAFKKYKYIIDYD